MVALAVMSYYLVLLEPRAAARVLLLEASGCSLASNLEARHQPIMLGFSFNTYLAPRVTLSIYIGYLYLNFFKYSILFGLQISRFSKIFTFVFIHTLISISYLCFPFVPPFFFTHSILLYISNHMFSFGYMLRSG